MNITLPKFFNDIMIRDFNKVKIKFRNKHWFFKYILQYYDTIWLIKDTIWFESEEVYNLLAKSGRLTPLLAHEYMHLYQKKHKTTNWFFYNTPQIVYLIFVISIFLLFNIVLSWSGIYFTITFILSILGALLPLYSRHRITMESQAYKMYMLVEMMRLYQRFSIEKVVSMCKTMPKSIVDILFSRLYWCMWTPKYIQEQYQADLDLFFGNIVNAMNQLAFVKKNSYIVGVTGVYADIFNYYAFNQLPSR